MRLSELLRLVWINLVQNKLKVILTSIGIVVGAATIMMVIAIGTGGKMDVADQFKNLNAGAVDVSYESASSTGDFSSIFGSSDSGSSTSMPDFSSITGGSSGFSGGMSGGMSGGFGGDIGNSFGSSNDDRMNQESVTLTTDDLEDLETFIPGIESGTITYTTSADVEGGTLDEATSYTIAGTLSNYAELSNLTLSIGEYFTDENNENKEKVCVLGYSTAQAIFGSAYDAYDEVLYIDDRPYVVAGVLEEMGSVSSGISPDTAVFIPYETGVKYITGDSISPTITVIASDVNDVDQIMEDVETVLADSYPNTTFTLSDAGSKMDAASASNTTLTLLLISMAIIVFMVGGIGIMNVLFVSVKERTNEIGILKALGCSKKDILLEFLLEASCMSLVGSLIGVLLSIGITPIVESFSVRVELSLWGGAISFAFGVITGTVFGFYPAYKASKLVPVEALNHE